MSKIGNYVVGLEELTGAVMAFEPFGEVFAIDEVYGCDYCGSDLCYQTEHSDDCPVVNLREVLTKQGQSK